MKASFLAVAILAIVAISSADDEECLKRRMLGLPVHWPNPLDCGSFYRCTNKNVKRHIVCPAGKEYNSKNGRCAPLGRNLCKLSLRLALDESSNPCIDVLSGTYAADSKSCRGFNICNNNMAYPQTCDAGSFFNTSAMACVPDSQTKCWENLCLNKESDEYLVNPNNCYSFYVCANKVTLAQDCPKGSYFDKTDLNCQPGVCPTDVTTSSSTVSTDTTASSTTTTCVTTPTTTCATPTTTSCITNTPVTTTTTCDTATTTTPHHSHEQCAKSNCDQAKCRNTDDFFLFPANGHSHNLYCMCWNHEAFCRKCPDGSVFVPHHGGCIPSQTTSIPETTTTTPSSEVTTTSKITTTTKRTETTTPEINDQECDKSNCNQKKCLLAPDLTVFPASSNNKRMFCLCLYHQAVCRLCPEGSDFDPNVGACFASSTTSTPSEGTTTTCATTTCTEEDTTTTTCITETTTPCNTETYPQCAIDTCEDAEDDTCYPFPGSDNAYCVCIDKKPEYRECPEGTIFHPDLGVCAPEIETTTPCKCPGGIEEGESVANPNNCMLYYVCCKGELVKYSCESGMYYDEETNSCILDKDGVCADCHHDQKPAQPRSKRSVLPSDASDSSDCTCPGGYQDGDVIPHPTDCDKKLVCCHGELKEESCGFGYYFNAALKECMKDVNNVCWPAKECEDGQLEKHPSNCSKYMACCHGAFAEKSCDHGYYFNTAQKKCVKDINNVCWPKDPKPTCEGGFEEGHLIPNPANCSSYFECSNGEFKQKYCAYGYYYSNSQRGCIRDTNNICWPVQTPSCPAGIVEGDRIENPADCATYLTCLKGKMHEVSCGYNMYYNKYTKDCENDTDHVCWPKEPSCGGVEEGGKIKNPSDCASYYVCRGGELKLEKCDNGEFFNSQTKKCETDTNNVCLPSEAKCDGGLEEGEKVPNPDDCSSYKMCCHGDIQIVQCGKNMVYNSTLGECVADVNHICWPEHPPCTEGDKYPNPEDCSTYRVCSDGKYQVVSCGDGMVYNSTVKKCVRDVNNICWPKEPPCKEGERYPNPDDCASYLVCSGEKYKVISCEKGQLYNSTLKKCVDDVHYVCWPKVCDGGLEEGEKVPNPDDCSSYKICCQGEVDIVHCGDEMYYNSTLEKCVPDVHYVCWPEKPKCDGGLEEGEKVPNPDDCSSYKMCCHGDIQIVQCGKNMVYNSTLGECVADVNHICWPEKPPCTEGDKYPNPEDCSTYRVCSDGKYQVVSCGDGMVYNSTVKKCVRDVNNICWPKEPPCKEGEKYPNPEDCASYLVCSGEKYKVVSCDKGQLYSSTLKKCVDDVHYVCWPKACDGGLEEGEKVPNPDDCSSYKICCQGEVDIVHCGDEMYYNSTLQKCVDDVHNVCWPEKPKCDGGLEEGEKVPNPDDCSSYKMCCHGDIQIVQCGKNMVYNSTLGECVADVNHICWPEKPPCTEGDKYPNPEDCSTYRVCSNGKYQVVSCGDGMVYNSTVKKCVRDVNNICWPKEPPCKEGERYPNPEDCATYLVCSGEKYKVVSCDKGQLYSSTLKKCVDDVHYVCWPKACDGGLEEGEKVPNPDDCSSYKICCQGEVDIVHCGDEMYYNSTLQKCVDDVHNVCWPEKPKCDGGLEEGEKVPNPDDCSSYKMCCHGDIQIVQCGKNMVYNSTLGECVADVNHICWPEKPPCTEGDKYPNPEDCSTYRVCSNGKYQVVSCGDGMVYNSTVKKCVRDVNNICWPKEPPCKEGERYPNPEDCASYLVCSGEKYKVVSCDKGQLYSSTLKKCVDDVHYVCWPKICDGGLEEGEKIPNPDNCSSYKICCQGEVDIVHCGDGMYYNSTLQKCVDDVHNVCWPEKPKCDGGLEEGEKVPNPDDCSSYKMCCHGDIQIVQCGKNMVYNSTLGECVADVNHICWPEKPPCTEGDKYPNPEDCSTYRVCSNGKYQVVSCGDGMVYNSTVKKCVRDVNNICWPKEPPCKEGERYPNPEDCASYLVCSGEKYKVVSCDKGQLYSSTLKKCVDDVHYVCWPKICDGGLEEGEKIPNPDNCSSYKICCQGEVDIVHCGDGMYYNSTLQKCVDDVHNVCWPEKPKCDGGLEEGEKVPNPDDCSSYKMCCHGDIQIVQCGKNMVYNSTLSECVADVNHICWPEKPPCTEGDKYPNPEDCSTYRVCSNGKYQVVSCGDGMVYNSTVKKCVRDVNNICWPKEPPCKEGERYPNPEDCASYLVCSGEKYKVVSCDKGQLYSSTLKKCVDDVHYVCWPKICDGGLEEGEKIPNPDNCSSYKICCQGEVDIVHCGDGMYYNSTLQKCVDDVHNVCWPEKPKCDGGLEEGEKVPNPDDCSSYKMCCHGDIQIVQCGKNMVYNSTLGECVADVNHICWPEKPPCTEGDKYPNPEDCSTYRVCSNGKYQVVSCGDGMVYNSTVKKCVRDVNNICWPKEPPCKEGERYPNPEDCASYLVCSGEKYKVVSCDKGQLYSSTLKKCVDDVHYVCWPKICDGGLEEGEKIPNPDNCSSYKICCQGEVDIVHCGDGMYYNSTLQKCVDDVHNVCWPEKPKCDGGLEEGEKVPNPDDCSSYKMCCHGDIQIVQCGKNMVYNSTLSECVADVNHICWPEKPPCTEGDKYPNPEDCSTYRVCSDGKYQVVSCGDGMVYNSTVKKCVRDVNNICWPKEPPCKEGERYPNPEDCASYLVCSGEKYKVVSCDKGQLYSSTLKKCVDDVHYVCWPKACDGGLEEGEKIPNPDDCSSYKICCQGEVDIVHCGDKMYYNSTLQKCVDDVHNVCWTEKPKCDGGLEEGEKVPNPDDCSSYKMCCHGDMQIVQCGKNMVYNSTLGECVADVNHICWPEHPPCTEGDRYPNPEDCSTYRVCTCGKYQIVNCGNGMIYNSTLKECIRDVHNICWPKDPPCKEGERYPNPEDCASYLVCSDEKYKVVSCDKGQLYNSNLKKCVDDVNYVCWSKACDEGLEEGEKIPNPDDCSSYKMCCHGDLQIVQCGEGMLYNSTLEQCVADINNICWHEEPKCDGGLEEGEKVPNLEDCSSYKMCCHGEMVVVPCGKNMLYNSTLEKCVPDIYGTCWQNVHPTCDGNIKDGEKVENKDNCVAYFVCCNGKLVEEFCQVGWYFNNVTNQCELDKNHICWPKDSCEEGQNVANPSNCSSYFSCCGGNYKLQFCEKGFYFNPVVKQCTFDVNNVCWIPPSECTCEGKTVGIATQCDKMAVCTNGQWQVESCGKSYFFNNVTLKCQPDTQHICWAKEPCTCAGGIKEGEKSPAEDCDKYYTCVNGVQILGKCGMNMFFNATSKCCQPDTCHKCWPNYCADQANGTIVANPKKCDGFYLCENGQQIEGVCESGAWFDPSQKSCQPDLNASCYNPCACQDQIKMLPHPDCTKFYFCNGNQTIVETCPEGGFDAAIGDCNPQKKCLENDCDDKPDYYTFADEKDKTKFYMCLKGVPVLKSCLPNTEFNGVVCAHISSPDCDPNPCSDYENFIPYATLNASEENAFCICRQGYATKQYCAEDYVFDTKKEACYTDAACDPLICKYSPDYTVSVNRNSNKTFCLCADNKPVIVACPNNGTFNSALLTCTNNAISFQCNQLECVHREDYYTYPDNTASTAGFCMCLGHEAIFKNCPENTSFDVKMGACRLKNLQCDAKQCQGLPNKTKIPALISSQGYCECVNNKATYYNCENYGEFDPATKQCKDPLCNPLKCEKADDYTLFPAVGSTRGFCMCINHEVTYKPCEQGGVFNTDMLVCQMPLKNCGESKCLGVGDNTKLPADYSIYGYCSCTGGKATYQECLNGEIFNAATQKCERENLPIEDVCDITYCDDPTHAGLKYPSIKNKYGYCQCSAAGPTFQHCPTGETFDKSSLMCRATVNSQCDLTLCADATPNKGYPIPTKSGNTSFCYCTGPGNAMLINCPSNLYYNDKVKKCVSNIVEGCSCPGGLHNGDIIADKNDCSKYFICTSGSMHQATCPAGQYFDNSCKKCKDDTNGQCIKKDPCTCLGTYHEGELLAHPFNRQMYYECQNSLLQERNCGTGRIFNTAINQCTREPRTSFGHRLSKRSVNAADNEFYCLENEKRSVSSNCAQYEICHNHSWYLESCPPVLYFNADKRECMQPQDDTVCPQIHKANLSECNDTREGQLNEGPTCQHYYRCQQSKWQLNMCNQQEFYNAKLATCLPHNLKENFDCNKLNNYMAMNNNTSKNCQDLTMRPYKENCNMYLLCLDNEWWYNYCPAGMYFNESINYCLTDGEFKCPGIFTNETNLNSSQSEIQEDSCQLEGLLKPSSLKCNRYFICDHGKWQQKVCDPQKYFDSQLNQCLPDVGDGKCQASIKDCVAEETRWLQGNCSTYEKCSREGKWLRIECSQEEIYDELLRQCVPNDNEICSHGGLRRVCQLQETRKVITNCTQFLYCLEEKWTLMSCLEGTTYWHEKRKCVNHSTKDKCQPLELEQKNSSDTTNLCYKQLDGTAMPHKQDCTRYYICVNGNASHEILCPIGSYFDSLHGYCAPNDKGTCRVPFTGPCANATADSLIAHPTDCQAYYLCSSTKGQQLMHCPPGQYYHNETHQCQIDKGECKSVILPTDSRCSNTTEGSRMPHETHCNMYYMCVHGFVIPIECPDNNLYNPALKQCVWDQDYECVNGKLVNNSINKKCQNLTDGSYIPDEYNCTSYYICSQGKALREKCASKTYFNASQLMCILDDGTCPFVNKEESSHQPPDPGVCKDKHGNLMPDPLNCNNFYVCINGKLRHERCYPQYFFNYTLNQCQQKAVTNVTNGTEENIKSISLGSCSRQPTSIESMCKELGVGSSLAEQGDCRLHISCEEEGTAISQRCRNGESYDSLIGFCRQNDGTCQMDSGQRAGECNNRHGQLAKDAISCRKYFICINGQKIARTCSNDEYFSKTQNMCIQDKQKSCPVETTNQEWSMEPISCQGLSDGILYPYIPDNCRSYFQCIKGVVKVHQCGDSLHFDPISVKCIQNHTECVMPVQTEKRTSLINKTDFEKLCSHHEPDQPYANFETHCRSFYTCHLGGDISHELCPLGMAFDNDEGSCIAEENVMC